jgi:quercetin dioxygenase-like cupin family protein
LQRTHIVSKGTYSALDVFGPTIEFLTLPEETDAAYVMMMGTIPSGVSVPLHSHPDLESFACYRGQFKYCLKETISSNGWM